MASQSAKREVDHVYNYVITETLLGAFSADSTRIDIVRLVAAFATLFQHHRERELQDPLTCYRVSESEFNWRNKQSNKKFSSNSQQQLSKSLSLTLSLSLSLSRFFQLLNPPLSLSYVPFHCLFASQVRLAVGGLVRFANYGNLLPGGTGEKGQIVRVEQSHFEALVNPEVDFLLKLREILPKDDPIAHVRLLIFEGQI